MKKIKNNMNVVVVLVFILVGIFGIPAIIGATPNKNTIDWNDPVNIAHFNYMDSCYIAYQTIDAAYRIDDGDAINCEYYDNAMIAWDCLDIETFKANWKELDKDIICFLSYRAFQEHEEAAWNLLYKYYPNVIKEYYNETNY